MKLINQAIPHSIRKAVENEMKNNKLDIVIAKAKQMEFETGITMYIVWANSINDYIITTKQPLICHPWFTTDGIQHG